MGAWVVPPMLAVAAACALAAIGLWRRTRWGYRIAVGLLAVNLAGDAANALIREDPRTLVGLPIGVLVLAYLFSRGVRDQFAATKPAG